MPHHNHGNVRFRLRNDYGFLLLALWHCHYLGCFLLPHRLPPVQRVAATTARRIFCHLSVRYNCSLLV